VNTDLVLPSGFGRGLDQRVLGKGLHHTEACQRGQAVDATPIMMRVLVSSSRMGRSITPSGSAGTPCTRAK